MEGETEMSCMYRGAMRDRSEKGCLRRSRRQKEKGEFIAVVKGDM